MELMFKYNACHTGLFWLIAITSANVFCLFAVASLLCLLSWLSFYM
jgi:hypothetical protein